MMTPEPNPCSGEQKPLTNTCMQDQRILRSCTAKGKKTRCAYRSASVLIDLHLFHASSCVC